jgi:hypothetical protein
MSNIGRDWTPLKEVQVVETAVELRKMTRLYQDADFEENIPLARVYRRRVKHLQALVDAGVEVTVNF